MDFIQMGIIDIIDILAIAMIMYYLYKLTRGSQASNILSGVLLIYLLWIVVRALNMEMLSAVLGHIIGVGVVGLIVVFQPEIRRFIQMLGIRSQRRGSFLNKLFDFRDSKPNDTAFLEPLVKACSDMSATKTGALIVIQQQGELGMVIETGIMLNADITALLLENIFFKNAPLHDGAVVINTSRIVAAKCILPSTQSNVPVSFGMRHRAALGISEVTDAIVVVVSEETGKISVAHNGQIKIGVAPGSLAEVIRQEMESVIDVPQQTATAAKQAP